MFISKCFQNEKENFFVIEKDDQKIILTEAEVRILFQQVKNAISLPVREPYLYNTKKA